RQSQSRPRVPYRARQGALHVSGQCRLGGPHGRKRASTGSRRPPHGPARSWRRPEAVPRFDAIPGKKVASGHRASAFGLEFEDLQMTLAGGDTKLLAVSGDDETSLRMSRSARRSRAKENQSTITPEGVGMRPGVKPANQ